MSEHLSPSALDAYVTGSLGDVDMARVEAHVMACSACAARLQHEACLEMVFEAVVAAPVKPKPVRVIGASAVAGGAIAMAAAMLVWLAAPRGDSGATQATPSIIDDPAVPTTVMHDYEANRDASTFTASLDVSADGSRLGIRD
jgi:anti-sigma factor RsiW